VQRERSCSTLSNKYVIGNFDDINFDKCIRKNSYKAYNFRDKRKKYINSSANRQGCKLGFNIQNQRLIAKAYSFSTKEKDINSFIP